MTQLSPKWWVIYDTENEDILTLTMSKSLSETESKLQRYMYNFELYGNRYIAKLLDVQFVEM